MRQSNDQPHEVIELHPDCEEYLLGDEQFPSMSDFGISLFGYSLLRTHYRIRRQLKGIHLLLLVGSGEGEYQLPNRQGVLKTGECLFIPANTPFTYQLTPLGQWQVCWVLLREDSLWRRSFPSSPQLLASDQFTPMQQIFTLLERERYCADAKLVQHALVAQCAAYVQRLCGRLVDHSGDPRLMRLLEAIQLRPQYHWDLAALCREANLSRSQLQRLSQQCYGCSPLQLVIQVRLTQAAMLLKNSLLAVKEVAIETGFANQFHFSRAFKYRYGCAPSQYRKQQGFR